jgi:hypothetical protein
MRHFPRSDAYLRCLAPVSGVSLSNGGNIKFAVGQSDWAGPMNTTIQLVYDGANWREIARSDTRDTPEQA